MDNARRSVRHGLFGHRQSGRLVALLLVLTPALAVLSAQGPQNGRKSAGQTTHLDHGAGSPVADVRGLSGASGSGAYESHRQIASSYGKLPIRFEPNVGQAPATMQYLARAGGFSVGLSEQGALLSLRKPADSSGQNIQPRPRNRVQMHPTQTANLRFRLAGANPKAAIEPEQPLSSYSNYLIGNDPNQWHTGVANYGAVRYSQVYPGIDWVVYGNPQQLEYDLVVAPQADPRKIQLTIDGADRLSLDVNGDLLVKVKDQTLRQLKPVIYQTQANGEKKPIEGHYRLDARYAHVAFALGNYDHTKPLVIDPAFYYSTYYGGGANEYGNGIAVDSAGNAYIAGATDSSDFPTVKPLQTYNGTTDLFVTKLNAAGSAAVYSTLIGGNGPSQANAIAVDASGNAYVAGLTNATNFPTVNPLQSTNKSSGQTGFVLKLNAAGSAEVYGTYLGGTGADTALAIAVDTAGDAYVAGYSNSANFPVSSAYQRVNEGGEDAFVVKLDAAGTSEVYGTYLGGSGTDQANAIAVDSSGDAYVAGYTTSTNFPVSSPLQSENDGNGDAFVVELNAAGNAEVYGTYLGGSAYDIAIGIAVDSGDNAYATGYTESTNFPTSSPLQSAIEGDANAFVVKFNAGGSAEVYGTYLGGGSTASQGNGIAVDSSGDAYIAGYTQSTAFPTSSPLQSTNAGSNDAFVVELNSAGSAEVYGTYLGGGGEDYADAIALDSSGNAYVTGQTNSTNFPTANALQRDNASGSNGTGDVFIAKIGNPCTVEFGLSEYTVDETAGSATITVERSAPFSEPATVAYAATAGTAVSGTDFTPESGTLSWSAGDTSEKTFTVPILNSGNSTDKTVNLTLSDPGLSASLGSPSTSVLDIAADVAPTTLQFAQPNYSVNEYGKQVYVAVTRTGSAKAAVTVAYATSNLGALSGTNYTAASGTLSWAAGDNTVKYLSLTILDTTVQTSDESFAVTLSSPTGGATIGGINRTLVDILNSQAPMPAAAGNLSFGASAFTVNKPDGTVSITLLRNAGSNGPVSVNYATSNGTAAAGTDYTATSGTLTWANGDATSKSFSIPITTTSASTGSKTVNLTLSAAAGGASLGSPSTAVLTIDESATSKERLVPGSVAFGLPQYSMDRSAGMATVTVARLDGTKGGVSVDYATQDGTAVAGTDYAPVSGTLTWDDGDADLKTFTIQMLGGETGSGNKTLSIFLSNPQGGVALASPSTAQVTLIDPGASNASAGVPASMASGSGAWGFETLVPLIGLWRLRRRRRTEAHSR